MEKAYQILKKLLLVLCAVALQLAMWRFAGKPAASESVEAAQTEAQTLPDFVFYDGEGTAYKLSDFRGKPVVLNFWASWCGPCKNEMPDLEAAWQEYGEDIHFLMVNLTDGSRETVETAAAYIGSQGYTFPVYFDTDLDGIEKYGINAIPVTYFVDEAGILVTRKQGMLTADELQAGLDRLLA